MIDASFDSTKTRLEGLLKQAKTGKLQLPDFQRDWVWDDERIRSLLASVSVSFPIGAVMLLAVGNESMRFKPCALAGCNGLEGVTPETLVLDGQQRLTSLFWALMGETPVQTKDVKRRPIRRWYYFDIKKCLANSDEREEAIVSVPENRLVKTFGGEIVLDVTTPQREYAQFLFPANRIFDSTDWRVAFCEHWGYDKEAIQLYNEFEKQVIKRFEQYQVPVIELKKETPKEAVCLVFERVNTGGVPLGVFELLTASFAAENYLLRKDWEERRARLKQSSPLLETVTSDQFLQAVTLLVTQARQREALSQGVPPEQAPGIGCRRRDILKLEKADWVQWADKIEEAFKRAAKFLHRQKIFQARDIPYPTQLVPLAAILADLGSEAQTEGAFQKISRWFWRGVLGELYGSTIETRFARDLPEVVAWVRGEDSEPSTVQDAHFEPGRLLTLRSRNSAAYKGLYALLMREGSRDFMTGDPVDLQTYFDERIDIHHIFPRAWCKEAGIKRSRFNSIINKTAISRRTNQIIGGQAPSAYLARIKEKAGIDDYQLDLILRSHCIDPELLRNDRLEDFFQARAEELLKRIEAAMGKTIPRQPELFAAPDTTQIEEAAVEDEEEEDEEEALEDAAA